ncbi:unnamed protein product [Clonostachys byssicola]|uniref:Uncharacterized protein n=1 Tax=Clonostachys byssicola TaxID=160290 RepID=A0A9N9Y928_9HYPO|nr:unnamed protein product [Clonostachys byssicola]
MPFIATGTTGVHQLRRSSKDLMVDLMATKVPVTRPAAQASMGKSSTTENTSKEMEAASALVSLSSVQTTAEDVEAANILLAMSRS